VAAPSAELPFAERRQVSVIADEDWATEPFLHNFLEWEVFPAWQVGRAEY
jgi:hypothetical protein